MASNKRLFSVISVLLVSFVFVSSVKVIPKLHNGEQKVIIEPRRMDDESQIELNHEESEDFGVQNDFNEEIFTSFVMKQISKSKSLALTSNPRFISFRNLECNDDFPTYDVGATSLVRITSPDFPLKYPRNSNCGWKFQIAAGSRMDVYCYIAGIRWNNFIKFIDSDFGNSTEYDWIFKDTRVIHFKGSKTEIQFKSNNRKPHDGFVCLAFLVPASSVTPTPYTTTTITASTAPTTASTAPTTASTASTTAPTAAPTTTPSLNGCRCGRKKALRIVGGVVADDKEFPWIVSIRDEFGSNFCGGSLISCDTILTAAHCVAGESSVFVDIGMYRQNDATNSFVSKKTTKIISHKDYNSNTLDYDIAILKIDCVAFSDEIIPVCLPNVQNKLYVGEDVTVAGWGTKRENAFNTPNTLHKVVVPVISNSKCNQKYDNAITRRMLCAGFDNGGKDSCQGDSGGPLMYTSGGVTEIAGVVSWGEGCAKKNKPGVYTDVAHLLDWVKNESGLDKVDSCPR